MYTLQMVSGSEFVNSLEYNKVLTLLRNVHPMSSLVLSLLLHYF